LARQARALIAHELSLRADQAPKGRALYLENPVPVRTDETAKPWPRAAKIFPCGKMKNRHTRRRLLVRYPQHEPVSTESRAATPGSARERNDELRGFDHRGCDARSPATVVAGHSRRNDGNARRNSSCVGVSPFEKAREIQHWDATMSLWCTAMTRDYLIDFRSGRI
jgi:hypothetical protein